MAIVPDTHDFITGLGTSSEANAYIRDPIRYLRTPPILRVRRTTTQSIANSSPPTAIIFDTRDTTDFGMWSSGTNPSRCTAVYAGWYRLGGGASFVADATGRRGLWWRINGSDVNGSQAMAPAGVASVTGVAARSILVFLNVGDYVELMAYQDRGSALNISGTTFEQPSMDVVWESI